MIPASLVIRPFGDNIGGRIYVYQNRLYVNLHHGGYYIINAGFM